METKSPKKPKKILPWLDMVRGLAALAVMLDHLRDFYFVKWDDLHRDSKTTLNFLLFAGTRMGHEAVLVFFVLSGYLVGGSALKQFLARRFHPSEYALARMTRLYVVLFPALLFTLLCDQLRLLFDPSFAAAWRSDIDTFLGNLGFLQNVCVRTYGSNSPLWSLGYEFWYYFVCGATLMTLRFSSLSATLGGLFGVILALVIMPHGCLVLLPIWCAGGLVKFNPIRLNFVVGLASLLVFIVAVGWSLRAENTLTDFVVGFAFLPLLAWLVQLPEMKWKVVTWLGHWLANFSFTLYANHYPLLGLLLIIFVPVRLLDAGLFQWLGLAGLAILIMTISYGLYWCFEERTERIRQLLANRLILTHPSRR